MVYGLVRDFEMTEYVERKFVMAIADCDISALHVLIDSYQNESDFLYMIRSMLTLAVKCACLDCSEILLNIGVSVDSVDEEGNTPLFWAVTLNQIEVVGMLLRYGANPCLKNFKGIDAVSQSRIWNRNDIESELMTVIANEAKLKSA